MQLSNLQSILDRLGQPPPELCLDWVWQLQRIGRKKFAAWEKELSSRTASPSLETQSQHTAWNDVWIDSNGKLDFRQSKNASDSDASLSLQQLVDQLLDWSGHTNSQAEIASPTRLSPAKLRSQKSPKRVFLGTRSRALTASLGLLVVASLLIYLSWGVFKPSVSTVLPSAPTANMATANGPTTSKTPSANTASETEFKFGGLQHESNTIQTGTISLLAGGPTSDTSDPFANSLNAFSTLLEKNGPLVGSASGSSDDKPSLLEDKAADLNLDHREAALPLAQSTPTTTDLDTSNSIGQMDVLADLKLLSSAAEKEQLEKLVASETNSSTVGSASPLLIATSPIFQIQKFDKTLRIRKPQWKLQLALSEGFLSEPSEPQQVSGREIATWLVREQTPNTNTAANSQSAIQVLVQAELVGSRDASLRWRIVAGAEDLPMVVVPLDKQYLDALQSKLGQQIQLIQLGVDRLRQMSRAGGLPTEAQSAMSTVRRHLEQQRRLADRLLQVVADANQLQGWLDGQIEIHAELIDMASADSTALLQFGKFANRTAELVTPDIDYPDIDDVVK